MIENDGTYGIGHASYAMQLAFSRWLKQLAMGPPCAIELYADAVLPMHIGRYTVRRLKPGEYRAIVLHNECSPTPARIQGHDGTRDSCRAWLTAEGIPVLRIGAAQGQ